MRSDAQVNSFNANLVYYYPDSLQTEFVACFPFGNGICQIYKGSTYSIQNDTMICNSYYDKTGFYSLFGCCSVDTINIHSIPNNIRYLKVIENIYSMHPVSVQLDTTLNVNDTTIVLYPTNDISIGNNDKIRIYPNPFYSTFHIEVPFDFAQVEIYDSYGSFIKIEQLNSKKSQVIDLTGLQSKLFFIKISNKENYCSYFKIIKI